jgi:hypothetical protein
MIDEQDAGAADDLLRGQRIMGAERALRLKEDVPAAGVPAHYNDRPHHPGLRQARGRSGADAFAGKIIGGVLGEFVRSKATRIDTPRPLPRGGHQRRPRKPAATARALVHLNLLIGGRKRRDIEHVVHRHAAQAQDIE